MRYKADVSSIICLDQLEQPSGFLVRPTLTHLGGTNFVWKSLPDAGLSKFLVMHVSFKNGRVAF